MSEIKYNYKSIEDYLISKPLTVDTCLDDGWGAKFPVKGIELNASVLFADITAFSKKTLGLNPVETLIYVNKFFSWISAEALIHSHGLIDKYIGDEIMVVFANEFGSEDHFIDALKTARMMMQWDALDFSPHIGIASGPVVIGYVGTPLKYNCSVFGSPVILAARCTSVRSNQSKSIIFPETCWKPNYVFKDIFPSIKWYNSDHKLYDEVDSGWEKKEPRIVELKNIGEKSIIEIVCNTMHIPSIAAPEIAKRHFSEIKRDGQYHGYKHND